MGELLDLDRHRHRLRDELAAELVEHGCAQRVVAELPVPLMAWRRTARAAGIVLGRRVQTRLHPSGALIWAILTDWPAAPDEHNRHQQKLRDAVNALPDLTNALVVAAMRRAPR